MSLLTEFKKFIARGNVMDLAVGIIVGAAFTGIVNSLVKDVINPLIGVFSGGVDFSRHFINLTDTHYATLADAQAAGAATLNYGLFINAVINFLIVAFVVFMLVRSINRIKELAEKPQEEGGSPVPPPADVQLLTEIRDLLKKQQNA